MSKVNRNDPRRSSASESLYSLFEFERQFPNDAACLEWLVARLYPSGIFCPNCEKVTKHHREQKRPSYACQFCGHHEHPLKGTIFEDSATSLKLWFYAIYLMSATRCGISAKQIERETGVTYKTAWRMFNRIRSLLKEETKLKGPTEMDETYWGGKRKGRRGRPGQFDPKKTAIAGIAERNGRVVAKAFLAMDGEALIDMAKKYVLPESTIYTDEFVAYSKLGKSGYQHRRIHHKAGVYVMGDCHTNTIEGFWSLIKRGIGGVYHAVSQKYLQAYLDEYSFRYNHRNDSRSMFEAFLARIVKRPAMA